MYRKYDRRTIWDQLEKRLEQPLRLKEAPRKASRSVVREQLVIDSYQTEIRAVTP